MSEAGAEDDKALAAATAADQGQALPGSRPRERLVKRRNGRGAAFRQFEIDARIPIRPRAAGEMAILNPQGAAVLRESLPPLEIGIS